MTRYLAAYAGTAIAMIALDILWIGVVAKPLYVQGIGHLMAPQPRMGVAVLFYVLFAAGIVYFAVSPQTDATSWRATLTAGALFGFFAYATYDLTNLATLKDWPASLAMIDLAWGTAVSLVSAAAGKLAMDWIG